MGLPNLEKLVKLAEHLRCRSCRYHKEATPARGSQNSVEFLIFDDGKEWAFWTPSRDDDPRLIRSEVTTLAYLKTFTRMPVPEVFHFCETSENDIGVPYILMSKAKGRKLSEYDMGKHFSSSPARTQSTARQLEPLPPNYQRFVMRQLGALMSALYLKKNRFSWIGSLMFDIARTSDSKLVVTNRHLVKRGEVDPKVYRRHFFPNGTLSRSVSVNTGPGFQALHYCTYCHETTYFETLVRAYVRRAKSSDLSHSFLSAEIKPPMDSNRANYAEANKRYEDSLLAIGQTKERANRLHFLGVAERLIEIIPYITNPDDAYCLSHPDLHAGNIYVDESMRITCIVGWRHATVGPKAALLATPGPMDSAVEPDPELVTAFREQFCASEDTNAEDRLWRLADQWWYFSRLLRMSTGSDLLLFSALHRLALPRLPCPAALDIQQWHEADKHQLLMKELEELCERLRRMGLIRGEN